MSLEEPSKRFAGPPPPRPGYPHQPEDGRHAGAQLSTPPSLPPMSSLLSGHKPPQPEQHPHPQSYPPRTYQPPSQPQYNESKHPLYLSEMNPSAPVHHIYHPPQENTQVPRYRAEPLLVPIQPANGLQPPVEHGEPIPQRRQSRKISQRREEDTKDFEQINRSSPTIRARSSEAERGIHSRPQELAPYIRKESVASESSIPKAVSPRDAQPKSVPIAGLLSSISSEPPRLTARYSITVRQQPQAARACGFGERDRRVIDPPPILQLYIEDSTASQEELSAKLRQPYTVVHCTLWNPVTNRDDSAMPGATDKRQQRRLMGTLVASPFVGLDENDVEGCFFCFPDLSVRTPGTYSLRFSLVVLDPTRMCAGGSAPINATVISEVFHVYNAKDFGGMRASTELTKRLKHQGCLISVKKGTKNNARDDDDDDDDDDDEQDGPPAKRGKKW